MRREKVGGEGRDAEEAGVDVVRGGDVDDGLHETPDVVLREQGRDLVALGVAVRLVGGVAGRPVLAELLHEEEGLDDALLAALLVAIEALVRGEMESEGGVHEI